VETAENYINHIAIVTDASASMSVLSDSVVKVTDNTVKYLADRSKVHDQETRATFYTFSSRGQEKCLFYDKDVLRMPSIKGLYHTGGMTALLDATIKAVGDLKATAQLYGKHAFLIYVITDGYENHSFHNPQQLDAVISTLPDNWTLAAFAPDQQSVFALKQCGFPAGNVSVWDTHSVAGVEDMGTVIQTATENFMEGRKHGIHGYSTRSAATRGGLFQMRDFSAKDVKGATPLTRGSYFFLNVTEKARIDEFVAQATMKPYVPGRSYYQFMKTETIQPQKNIAVEITDKLGNTDVYTGPEARNALGLPKDHTVKVRDIQKDGVTIFVQSTSFNRSLIPGTRLLTLR
jgi:hypothetical protein